MSDSRLNRSKYVLRQPCLPISLGVGARVDAKTGWVHSRHASRRKLQRPLSAICILKSSFSSTSGFDLRRWHCAPRCNRGIRCAGIARRAMRGKSIPIVRQRIDVSVGDCRHSDGRLRSCRSSGSVRIDVARDVQVEVVNGISYLFQRNHARKPRNLFALVECSHNLTDVLFA